jgi:hypothetical protein
MVDRIPRPLSVLAACAAGYVAERSFGGHGRFLDRYAAARDEIAAALDLRGQDPDDATLMLGAMKAHLDRVARCRQTGARQAQWNAERDLAGVVGEYFDQRARELTRA